MLGTRGQLTHYEHAHPAEITARKTTPSLGRVDMAPGAHRHKKAARPWRAGRHLLQDFRPGLPHAAATGHQAHARDGEQ
jgi:hypothetical protein